MSLNQHRIALMAALALKVAQYQLASNAVEYDRVNPDADAVAKRAGLEGHKVATATRLLSLMRGASFGEVGQTQEVLRDNECIDRSALPKDVRYRERKEAGEAVVAFDGILSAKGSRHTDCSYLRDLSQDAQAQLRQRAREERREEVG